MSPAAAEPDDRSFSVHGLSDAPARGRRIPAASFEEAALSFLDAYGSQDEGDEVALMVEDCESGERRCFRVDLATGATAACD